MQVTTALRVPAEPSAVRADDADVTDVTALRYDAETGVLCLRHAGEPAGTRVEITF